jgi:hypothetical protein
MAPSLDEWVTHKSYVVVSRNSTPLLSGSSKYGLQAGLVLRRVSTQTHKHHGPTLGAIKCREKLTPFGARIDHNYLRENTGVKILREIYSPCHK